MTNIETMIDFFESLNERNILFLTSDREHFARIAEMFRLAKNKEGKFDVATAFQLMDHYKVAQDTLSKEGKPYYRLDSRPISDRIKSVQEKGKSVEPQEFYDTVVGAIRYGMLILAP